MKKSVNFQADEETVKEFKLLSLKKDKRIGAYLEELMKQEIEKEIEKERENEDKNKT